MIILGTEISAMRETGTWRALRRYVPKPIRRQLRNRNLASIRDQFGRLSVAEAFSETYRRKLWGEADGEQFCSGTGSADEFAIPYTEWLARFIADHRVRTVVDLGCGDFRVGRRLCSGTDMQYVGVDVVTDLIAWNTSRFGSSRVNFQCLNIIDDKLPEGDLCLIRQVFQHLCNAEICIVLAKCREYPYLLITEHLYNGPGVQPNLDVGHGPDNRLFRNSGVFLDCPPFNLKTMTVLELVSTEAKSVLRTSLIVGENAAAH
jgi:SAM-dependent methyltransferase